MKDEQELVLTDPSSPSSPEDVSRRKFLQTGVFGACAVYIGAIGFPVFRYLNSPVEASQLASAVKEVTLDKANELAVGTALMFKFGTSPALLIHHADGSWVAMSAVCTHMGCTVKFDEGAKKITCACHGGVFDAATGENISGPPPRPLERYDVKVNDANVVVTKIS